jgi:hypothetical protein
VKACETSTDLWSAVISDCKSIWRQVHILQDQQFLQLLKCKAYAKLYIQIRCWDLKELAQVKGLKPYILLASRRSAHGPIDVQECSCLEFQFPNQEPS